MLVLGGMMLMKAPFAHSPALHLTVLTVTIPHLEMTSSLFFSFLQIPFLKWLDFCGTGWQDDPVLTLLCWVSFDWS